MRTTVHSYLDDFIARGDETAFAHRRGLRVARWSYAQTAAKSYQFARELEAREIGKGDRVLLWAENSPEWLASFFGCLLRGVIVVPLDAQSGLEFIARVQQQVEAKLAICDAETSSRTTLDTPILSLDEIDSRLASHSREPYLPTGIDKDDTIEIV